MKITLEEINAEQLLAIATALNNGVAPVANIAPVAEVAEEQNEDTIDFDKEGLPWDERIHSSNHKLTAQGVWTRRRGITDEVYNAIKAELLGKWESAEPVVEEASVPVAPLAPVATPAFVPVQQEVAPVVAPTPVVAPAPVAPAPVASAPVAPVQAPTPAPAQSVFDTFSGKLQYALANKLIEANYMQGLLNNVNSAFGTSYQGMFEMRDNDNAMQFVINELAKKGI